jgi:hypothetical protein
MTSDTRPLSAGQEALWTAHRMAPESGAFNLVQQVRVRSVLDLPTLSRAVDAVVARHDQLGTRIVEIDGQPRRYRPEHTDRPAATPLDVREVPGADQQRVRDLLSELAARPFRLTEDIPFRAVLVRTAPDDAALMVVVHHVVADFTSLWLLMRDLLHAYAGIAIDGQPPWSAPPGSYDDHVEAERDLLASPAGARTEQLWRGVYDGAAPAELPMDRARPVPPTFRGDTIHLYQPPEFVDRLTAASKEVGVGAFAYLLGAFQSTVHRCSGQDEFLIGCPSTTRRDREMRDTVGCFVNSFPLRARFAPETTFREAILSAQQQVMQGLVNGRYPCVLLSGNQGGSDGAGQVPVLRTGFFMVDMDRIQPSMPMAGEGEMEGPQTEYRGMRLALMDTRRHQEGQLDLMVRVNRSRTLLDVAFSYHTDLYDRGTIERYVDYFARLMEAAVATPDERVSRARLVDGRQMAHLLALGAGEDSTD